MAVFLTVLKIIGLVILGIIALVLAIILLILTLVFTVPVKYDGHLAIGGEEDTETDSSKLRPESIQRFWQRWKFTIQISGQSTVPILR